MKRMEVGRRSATVLLILTVAMTLAAPALAGKGDNGGGGGGNRGGGGPKPKPSATPTPTPTPSPTVAILTAPWGTPQQHSFCSQEEGCDADAVAEESGYLDARAFLSTGVGSRDGRAAASVDGTYQLPHPVSSLTIEISGTADGSASATIDTLTAQALTLLGAIATHSACQGCEVNTSTTLASSAIAPALIGDDGCPGDDPLAVCVPQQGTPFTLTLEMTSPDGAVPAGDITIRTLISAYVNVVEAGSASAIAEGWVDQIVVRPIP